MRRVRIDGVGKVRLEECPEPTPGVSEVLIDIEYAGVCGSDLHTLHHGHPWLGFPLLPGHEATGIVRTVGPGVSQTQAGDRVYIMPLLPCGACRWCLHGRINLCKALRAVGSHLPGAMADSIVLPESTVRPIPAGMSLRAAALIEPTATVIHALTLSRLNRVHEPVAVIIGGGTIGQLMALCLNSAGTTTTVIEPVASKRQVAADLGAKSVVADLADVGPKFTRPDAVFDCVASPATIAGALNLLPPGGTLVLVGAGRGAAAIDIQQIQDQEINLVGSAMYVEEDFCAAAQLISRSDVSRLVTSTPPLDHAPTVLSAHFDRANEIKMLLRP